MKNRMIGNLVSLLTISVLSGCGSSSVTTTNDWNGKFVDAGVKGLDYTCGTKVAKTGVGGAFGPCPAGSSVTFKVGGMLIGSASQPVDDGNSANGSEFVITLQKILGKENSATNDDEVKKVAAFFLSLDNDPTDEDIDITLSGPKFATGTTATNISTLNFSDIESIIKTAIPTATIVTPDAAQSHLETTLSSLATIQVSQPTDASTN